MKKKSIIFVLFIGFIIGCSNKEIDINKQINDPNMIIENQSIKKWLELEKINYFTRKDDLIEVEASFRNLSSNNKFLAYRIDWMDKNGFIQKTILSKWTMIEVEERRSFIIHGIAPSIKVKSFKIRLQEPTSDDELRKDSYHYQYQGN